MLSGNSCEFVAVKNTDWPEMGFSCGEQKHGTEFTLTSACGLISAAAFFCKEPDAIVRTVDHLATDAV